MGSNRKPPNVPILLKEHTNLADEIQVVGDGPRTYVWIGREGECVALISHEPILRRLIAVLQERLGPAKGAAQTSAAR